MLRSGIETSTEFRNVTIAYEQSMQLRRLVASALVPLQAELVNVGAVLQESLGDVHTRRERLGFSETFHNDTLDVCIQLLETVVMQAPEHNLLVCTERNALVNFLQNLARECTEHSAEAR